MKIAVVGSGIAGLGAAWALSPEHDVVLFEKQSRLGGHTHTHSITLDREQHEIDTSLSCLTIGPTPILWRYWPNWASNHSPPP